MKAMLRKANSPGMTSAIVEVPAIVVGNPTIPGSTSLTGGAVILPVEVGAATSQPAIVGKAELVGVPTRVLAAIDHTVHELAKPSDVGPLSGDFDDSDLRLPRLQIVQGSGELSRMFQVGTLLFMNEVLFPATPPDGAPPTLRFIPVGLRKQFRENLEQGSEELPRVVNSIDEVRSLGGSIEWIGGEKPAWSPSAQVLLLLEKPEKVDHPGFSIEIDGKAYGPAMYYTSGGAYRALAQPIYNACQFLLRRKDKSIDISKRFWTMRIVRKMGDFVTYIPESRVTSTEVSDELKELCSRFTSATTE